ncbi:hypothetical protein ACB092_01G399100 [Castanea dentata]
MKAWMICKVMHTIAHKNVLEKNIIGTPTPYHHKPHTTMHAHAPSFLQNARPNIQKTTIQKFHPKKKKTISLFSIFLLKDFGLSVSLGFIRGLVAEPIWHSVHLLGSMFLLSNQIELHNWRRPACLIDSVNFSLKNPIRIFKSPPQEADH